MSAVHVCVFQCLKGKCSLDFLVLVYALVLHYHSSSLSNNQDVPNVTEKRNHTWNKCWLRL